MDGFDEVIKEFLVESYESLDQLDGDLIALEDAPEDLDRLASIFRTVHTIKGTSGFLALPKLERVAHVGENLLVPLRDGAIRLDADIADGLLGMVDAIREILSNLENEGGEGENNFEPLVDHLKALLDAGNGVAPAAEPAADAPAETDAPEEAATKTAAPSTEAEDDASGVDADEAAQKTVTKKKTVKKKKKVKKAKATEAGDGTDATSETSDADQPSPEPPAPVEAQVAEEPASAKPDSVATADAPPAEDSAATTDAMTANQSDPTPAAQPEPKSEVAPPPAPKPAKKAAPPKRKGRDAESADRSYSLADATVRIDVELLDKLMNLVGELVLSRNQILQFCSESEDATMVAACQRLNLITTELQEGVMKTRMQPIRHAWSKLPRVVRDLSTAFGKKVDVRMEGADTELDKTILEAIKDPLTHIVRNSVDHGIESPEVREANGKPIEGLLLLRAYHESGQVNIEIVDDGGGINCERIRDKAIEKGLISAEQAETMSERELTNLILLPGFSTAAKVTNVSGRGVGMDVVKTNIERIGGTLDIQSTVGQGTTLRIKIPLTLAIVPALIVKVGEDAYAIPQVGLLELVRLEGEKANTEIEFIHDVPVYRLRENLLPLVYLDEQLGLRRRRERGDAQESINIVVLQAEDRQFGLVVDAVTDTQEIVVKPLGQHLQGIRTYAGATIMGDGTVALILDAIGLAQRSNVLTEHRDRSLGEKSQTEGQINGDTEALLIVDTNEQTRAAVRLSTVARLEEFEAANVEQSGQSQVVQYRGEILPLISLNGYGQVDAGGNETLNTVVYSAGQSGVGVGVVVGRIVDIVHVRSSDNEDSSGRRIIHDRVTEVVDLEQVVRQSCPQLFDESAA